MASCDILIDSSSGKSTGSRFAICSGLHEEAHRRSFRGPCRRPIQGTLGPGTAVPSVLVITPPRRSCTYRLSSGLLTSFATFGRLARWSACHWPAVARYAKPPLRVAAFRRSSREIVDGDRPSMRAISRTPQPRARRRAISSRSTNNKYRPDRGEKGSGAIPPLSRNQRIPTTGDTPAALPASGLDKPRAMPSKNSCRCSRRPAVGRPGGRIGGRRARSDRRRLTFSIATPSSQGVATTA
jgi:hypothetical protein